MEREIYGNYPVKADGNDIGEIEVYKSGLLTVFDAKCRDIGGVLRLSVYGDGEGYLGVMMPDGDTLRLVKKFSRAAMIGFPSTITHAGPSGAATDAAGQLTEPPERAIEAAAVTETADEAIPTAWVSDDDVEQTGDSETVPAALVSDGDAVEEAYDPEAIVAAWASDDDVDQSDDTEAVPVAMVSSDAVEPDSDENERGTSDTIWAPAPNPWSLFSDTAVKMSLRRVRGSLSAVEDGRTLLAIPFASGIDVTSLPAYRADSIRNIEGSNYAVFDAQSILEEG